MLAAVLADNRRSAYRVRPIVTDNLKVALVWNEERFEPHEVADVTFKGASIRFAKNDAPKLRKGDPIRIAIESPNLPGGATVTARVVFAGESTTERLFGLAFTETGELTSRAGEQLFQLFNRREAYRDDDWQPISQLAATIRPIASAHETTTAFAVTVRNLSTTGVCLKVDAAADRFMHERAFVRLTLALPERKDPLEIVTRVCYRSVVDGTYYYGCHFDWQETPNAHTVLEDLTQYTLNRLDEGFAIINN